MTTTAPTWLEKLKRSVSWGDEIYHDHIDGIDCCWYEVDGLRRYEMPGSLSCLAESCAAAVRVQQATSSNAVVLFTDEQATAAQVEAAMFTTAAADVGCGFLEPQPKVHWFTLLNRFSEGRLLQDYFRDNG